MNILVSANKSRYDVNFIFNNQGTYSKGKILIFKTVSVPIDRKAFVPIK